LRPLRLVDKAATGHYRIDANPLAKAKSLTYGDLNSRWITASRCVLEVMSHTHLTAPRIHDRRSSARRARFGRLPAVA